MFFYFVVFVAVGFAIGMFAPEKVAAILIVGLTIAWAFVFGPWALASFIEMCLGGYFALKMRGRIR